LAGWLYDSLRGRPMFALQGSLEIPKTISVYWDQSNPRVNDWHEHLQTELKHASVLLVICSPGAAKEFPANDDLYFEIRWWITNRGRNSPILITPSAQRWIPEPIR